MWEGKPYATDSTHTVSLPATQLCCYFTTNYRDMQGKLEGWLLVKRSVSIRGPTSHTCDSNQHQRAVRAKRGASVRPNYRRSYTKQMAKWCVLGGERQLGSAELQMGNSSLIKCNSSTTNQSKAWLWPDCFWFSVPQRQTPVADCNIITWEVELLRTNSKYMKNYTNLC